MICLPLLPRALWAFRGQFWGIGGDGRDFCDAGASYYYSPVRVRPAAGSGRGAGLALGVISVSCLHDLIFLPGRKPDGVIARSRILSVGGVAKAVLIPQFLLNLVVYLVDRLLLGDFKKTAPGLFGNALEDLLAIGERFLGVSPSAPSVPTHTTHSAPSIAAKSTSVSVRLLIGEEDGIDERVGALGRLNRGGQGLLAACVHSIREDDERFAALLLRHQFVRRQVDSIIEESATTPVV